MLLAEPGDPLFTLLRGETWTSGIDCGVPSGGEARLSEPAEFAAVVERCPCVAAHAAGAGFEVDG